MNEIIIFTTPTCPHCHRAKEFLAQEKYRYIEKDISSDPIAQEELRKNKITSVPTFKINGKFVIGFDKKAILKLLFKTIISCPNCNKSLRIPSKLGKVKINCPHCQHEFFDES